MSLISSMNIAQQALSVNQAAITVISNNISNVDTPGYSKLRVNQAQIVNTTASAGNAVALAESCSGVTIASVQRYADEYLQSYYRQENSSGAYLDQYATIAANIEDLTNELNGTGLEEALSNFYSAVDALNDSPSDITARANFVQQAENVCSSLNNTSSNLSNIKQSLAGDFNIPGSLKSSQISGAIDDTNALLSQIADVNYGIIKTNSSAGSSAALLDQRDSLLQQLSALIPAEVTINPNGTAGISINNINLVSGTKTLGTLNVESVNADPPVTVNFTDEAGVKTDITSQIDSGAIGAILDATGNDPTKLTISGVLGDLDDLASTFADVLNEIQNGDPQGTDTIALAMDKTTKKLIEADPATDLIVTSDASATITAGNISVNSVIASDPYLVAAARLDRPSYLANPTDYENQTGNSSNATLLTNSRTASNPALGGLTLEGYIASTVAGIGAQVANINTSLENQTLVLKEVESNLQSSTGVNLDEELVDLVKYQRAYQAAARVFNVCNDLLAELVHLGE